MAISTPHWDIVPLRLPIATLLPAKIAPSIQPERATTPILRQGLSETAPADQLPAAETSVDLPAILSASIRRFSVLWLAGAIVGLLRIAHGWWEARRLLGDAIPTADDKVAVLSANAAAILGRPSPPILLSRTASVPLAIGLVRPCVVIPQCLFEQLSAEQLLEVIVHEGADSARGAIRSSGFTSAAPRPACGSIRSCTWRTGCSISLAKSFATTMHCAWVRRPTTADAP